MEMPEDHDVDLNRQLFHFHYDVIMSEVLATICKRTRAVPVSVRLVRVSCYEIASGFPLFRCFCKKKKKES